MLGGFMAADYSVAPHCIYVCIGSGVCLDFEMISARLCTIPR